ncbi:hypothetical protein N6H18_18490 [Reichenbachiella agarivorans]|uniref:Lipoprotein n=1 Tax=Reichenbachiella agarivorans TaxID=2979464 RepID=A0ABY6CP92_9BACT|nr:hypothetical protein [Reichenbachiella agarivorans]UXP32331.1 hypothetical protein N6H18_18490 [Reichenbachiella agarivorans]
MKKSIAYMPLSLAFSLVILVGCGSKNETTTDPVVAEFLEPDSYFEKAIVSFDQGDSLLAVAQIDSAIAFIASVEVKSDTVHTDIIEFSISDLTGLSQRIISGTITSSDQMKDTFSDIDRSLGMYHLHVIEAWILNETNDQESIERMHRALTRTSYALAHADLRLTDDELQELSKAKADVQAAEKATLPLWKRIKATIEVFNQRMDDNSNSLDGTL